MLNVVLPFVVIVAFSLFVTVPSNSVVLFVCTVLSFVKLLIISFDDVRFVSPLFIMLLNLLIPVLSSFEISTVYKLPLFSKSE